MIVTDTDEQIVRMHVRKKLNKSVSTNLFFWLGGCELIITRLVGVPMNLAHLVRDNA